MKDEVNLDPIKARLAAATPGPWGIQGAQSDYEIVGPGPSVGGWTQGPFVLEFSTWPSPRALKWKDAELIAHAPSDLAALVAEVERLRARAENAEDKATRFDLDRAGIEARERDAVELVELRAEVVRLRARAEKAEANYAFMVERAVNQHLDGYRELGARAAAAENERDELRAENRRLRDVLEWVNNQCPGKCAGVCDAALRDEHRDRPEGKP